MLVAPVDPVTFTIQSLIDAVAFAVQLAINTIAFSVETLLNPVAAIFDAVGDIVPDIVCRGDTAN